MVFAVARDELIIGSVLAFGTDQLTKWALKRLHVEECDKSIRGITVCLINLGIGFSTYCRFVPVPGIVYGITMQFVELWKNDRELAQIQKKLAELEKERNDSKVKLEYIMQEDLQETEAELKKQQELIRQIEQAIKDLEQQKQS